MKKKKTAASPKVGFYGPEMRSPQATIWMQCDSNGYMKQSHQRALEVGKMRHAFDTPDRKLRNQAAYNGGVTFCFEKE